MSTPVQSSGLKHLDNVSGANTFTMASPFTAGDSGVVCLSAFLNANNAPMSAVSIGGTAATRVGLLRLDANNSIEIWFVQSVAGGTSNVTVTCPAGSGYFITLGCDEWAPFAASAFDDTNTNNGNNLAPTVTSHTLAQASEIVYALTGNGNGNNVIITQPAGWTSMFNEPDGVNEEPGTAAWIQVASTAAVTALWSWGTSQPWEAVLATFKLAATGGGISVGPAKYITA